MPTNDFIDIEVKTILEPLFGKECKLHAEITLYGTKGKAVRLNPGIQSDIFPVGEITPEIIQSFTKRLGTAVIEGLFHSCVKD